MKAREIMFTTEDGQVYTFHELNAMKTKSFSKAKINGTVRVGIFEDDTDYSLIEYYDAEGWITGDEIYWKSDVKDIRPVRDIRRPA